MIKVGLFGLGHLGKIHLKCLAQTQFKVQGIYDPKLNSEASIDGINIFTDPHLLIDECDACILASPTKTHFNLAMDVLQKGKHVFIEKPMTSTVEESEKLVAFIKDKAELITQVGFVERYNPAYLFIKDYIQEPKFIEVHRLATFSERGSDVSVVFDLMIHDLDLILSMINAEITEIKANGVKLISDSLDICNARIEFSNKAVVNLTASRISMKSMRKFRIFQKDAYLSLDLNDKKAEIINLSDTNKEGSMKIEFSGKEKFLSYKSSGALDGNAIVDELNDFYNSIVNKVEAKISAKSALKTTTLADRIEQIAIQSSIL